MVCEQCTAVRFYRLIPVLCTLRGLIWVLYMHGKVREVCLLMLFVCDEDSSSIPIERARSSGERIYSKMTPLEFNFPPCPICWAEESDS